VVIDNVRKLATGCPLGLKLTCSSSMISPLSTVHILQRFNAANYLLINGLLSSSPSCNEQYTW